MNVPLEEIEYIFRNSNSPDELFDAFRKAITQRISNKETYKILLGNPILSSEELKMYTEHLSKVFSNDAYDYFMWTGNIFSHYSSEYERLEDSVSYYVKAIYNNPLNEEPYCRLLSLYNFDLNLPTNKIIIDLAEEGLNRIDKKSILCREMAKLYERLGLKVKAAEYIQLACKHSKEGN